MKVLLSAVDALPVSLDDIKDQLRLERDDTDQDSLLTGYIRAAAAYIENKCGRILITQTWQLKTREAQSVLLPFALAQEIHAVAWKDEEGNETPIDAVNYELVQRDFEESYLRFIDSWSFATSTYHTDPLLVTFTTGYGDNAEAIPAGMALILKVLVSHFYTNGLPALDTKTERTIFSLLEDYRIRRPFSGSGKAE